MDKDVDLFINAAFLLHLLIYYQKGVLSITLNVLGNGISNQYLNPAWAVCISHHVDTCMDPFVLLANKQ